MLEVLRLGELSVIEVMPRASNYTFLAEVRLGTEAHPVVYKPRSGEMPLWDFPEGTLCRREVAAYVLAEALGWPSIPPTVLRDGPAGDGSVQLFIEAEPSEHFFTLRERPSRLDDLRKVAAFDVVAGNGDRKGGHCLLGRDGVVWSVDHGLCFSAEPMLRTVIWDFAREPVPGKLLGDLVRVEGELRSGRLRDLLLDLLDEVEVDAAADRAAVLVAEGNFPAPGPGRSVPWPQL